MARRSSIVRVSVVGDARQLSQAFDQAERDTQRLGQRMQSVGRDFSRNVSLPIIAGFGLAARAASEFDESMTKIVTLVGVAAEQVNAWRSEVSDLAAETAQSSAALADGLFQITSAGFRGQAAMDVLESSAKAASLGLGEVDTVADAVTSAVNAYGAENLTAARATDILTAAVREGKLEASSLAPVLGKLLPTASSMGIAFEDVAGALAVMSRTGLDASEASTSLSAVMTALLKPGAEAKRTLEGVGLSMSDMRELASQPGGLIDVMRHLDGAFADNDEALVKVIPNVRAFRGVMNVLAQDASIVDGVMGGVADSVGLVDEAWEQLNDSPAFQLKQAVNELKVAGTDLGSILLPMLADFAQAVAEVGRSFREMSPAHQESIVKFGLLLAAVGPVLVILGKLATAWTAIKTAAAGAAVAQAAAGVAGAGGGAAAVGGSVAGLTARQAAQSQSMAALRGSATVGATGALATIAAPAAAVVAALAGATAAANKLGTEVGQRLNPNMEDLNLNLFDTGDLLTGDIGAWRSLWDHARGVGDAVDDVTESTDTWAGSLRNATHLTAQQREEVERFNAALQNTPDHLKAPTGDGFDETAGQVSNLRTQLQLLRDEQRALVDPVFRLRQAEDTLNEAFEKRVRLQAQGASTSQVNDAVSAELQAFQDLTFAREDASGSLEDGFAILDRYAEQLAIPTEAVRSFKDEVIELDGALRGLPTGPFSGLGDLPDAEREAARRRREVINAGAG